MESIERDAWAQMGLRSFTRRLRTGNNQFTAPTVSIERDVSGRTGLLPSASHIKVIVQNPASASRRNHLGPVGAIFASEIFRALRNANATLTFYRFSRRGGTRPT